MEYYVKSIIPMIEEKYDSFTNVEKNIADFFIHNQKKTDVSAKALSKKLFVSEASLSRFAKKCGYKGYREFIYQYEKTFVEEKSSVTGNTRMVLNTYQELLNKIYAFQDEEQIKRICKYLSEASRVFVCGKGSSGHAASEMELRFMRLGLNIRAISESDQMRMQTVFQDEHSVVIGLSISGARRDILYFLRESSKRGAKTILITANKKDSFFEFCTEVVLVSSLKELNHGNVISPQFPILVMLDVIYANYQEQDRQQKENFHTDTLRALGVSVKEKERKKESKIGGKKSEKKNKKESQQ